MLRPVLLIIAAVLSIALYRMISRGGKTYSYKRTLSTTFLPDGTEQTAQGIENGVITINNRFVIIDGVEYVYKPYGEDPLEAVLEYENNALIGVRVLLPEGEKLFYIEKVTPDKSTDKGTAAITLA